MFSSKAGSTISIISILTVLQVICASVAAGILTGTIPVPKEAVWIPVVLVPILQVAASQLPKPGTEGVMELVDKVGKEEAEEVLRMYLHKKTQNMQDSIAETMIPTPSVPTAPTPPPSTVVTVNTATPTDESEKIELPTKI